MTDDRQRRNETVKLRLRRRNKHAIVLDESNPIIGNATREMRLENPLGYRSMHTDHHADHAEFSTDLHNGSHVSSTTSGTREIDTSFGNGAARMETSPLMMSPSQNNLLQMFKQFDRQFDQPHDDDHHNDDIPPSSSNGAGKESEMKT